MTARAHQDRKHGPVSRHWGRWRLGNSGTGRHL